MFPGLKTDSLALYRLFGAPYTFSIPSYQRNYAWTTREVGQLLDDITSAAGIEDAQAASPGYFLGTVLLLDHAIDVDDPQAERMFDIVDGQQRLMTVLLLAGVLEVAVEHPGLRLQLREMIEAGTSHGTGDRRCRLVPRDDERCFVASYLLAPGPKPCASDIDCDHDDGPLRAAFDYLRQEISAIAVADRETLARYLIECCHVVIIVTRDIDRAHLLFTVLNDRGRPLQRKDILKAEVLQHVPPAETPAALARWENAQSKLGNDFDSLFSHIKTIHAGGRPQIISAVRALIQARGCEAFLSEILTPMADAFGLVRRFGEFAERAAAHPQLAVSLTALNRFSHADWVPPAMLAMTRFEADPVGTARTVMEIERLMFLLKLLAMSGGKRQRRAGHVVQALSHGAPQDIEAAFAITKEEARAAKFHLRDIHRRNPSLAKLILMRIEDELCSRPLLLSTSELSVEHVLPQRPQPSSGWRKTFTDGEREQFTNSLGNLLLVPPKVNERLKNKEFGEKRQLLREIAAVNDGGLMLNRDVLGKDAWTRAEIIEREAQMIDILSRLWRLDPAQQRG